MTLVQYFDTPESVLPAELAYGALRVADAPLVPHQAAVLDFLFALAAHVREADLGEIWIAPLDVVLDARRNLVVQPDLLFISRSRRHIVHDRIDGAPDMVLEVLSPRPRVGRLEEHLAWFAEYGVRECWVYDQRVRRLTIVAFRDGRVAGRTVFDDRTPLRSAVLPAFQRPLRSFLR